MTLDVRERWRALTGGTLVELADGMTETQTFDTFTLGLHADKGQVPVAATGKVKKDELAKSIE